MKIEHACTEDSEQLIKLDEYITKEELAWLIKQKRVLVAKEGGSVLGWLRFGLFWDCIPFVNMLYVSEEHRNKSIGSRLVESWQADMKAQGYTKLMTSTLSSESGQHFYRKFGFKDIGGFILPDEPFEILFYKEI